MKKRTVNLAKNERLEDFGIRNTVSVEDRYLELKRQKLNGRQWMAALRNDPELAKHVRIRKVEPRGS